MKIFILILPVLILVSLPAYGMVYSWTDTAGVVHFTNKEHEIPARFRAKVKSRYPEQGDTAAQQLNISASQPKPEIQPPAPALLPKPEDQVISSQPAITPKSKNIPGQAARKARRSKDVTEE